ncbi:MAG: hypothetical protein QOJ98_2523 [Acidobacteriota bacterium]|jgi:hypothetical protein|nr:hypothetical protein [Acidobacteriota bacterium]
MKKSLALLLLVTASAFAQAPLRDKFPDDYKPSPCAADPDAVCESYPKNRFKASGTTYRGYDIETEWINAHWDEMRAAYKPLCTKIGNCFTGPGNDWIYCVSLMQPDFFDQCDRFPADSKDHDQCEMFTMTYWVGLKAKDPLQQASQKCMTEQPPREKTLDAFVVEKVRLDHNGQLTVHAYDAETHIPVRAYMNIETGKVKSIEGPVPRTGYPNKWKGRLKRVPNAEGHFDVAAPLVTLTAEGYKTLTFPMPMDVPKMVVEMTPPADQLKPGKNVITVTARDVATGKPVEARVMAEELAVGETNKPFELELTRRDKRPEIWVTSLFDHYNDTVVAKREE